jgi:hypothetical protein
MPSAFMRRQASMMACRFPLSSRLVTLFGFMSKQAPMLALKALRGT